MPAQRYFLPQALRARIPRTTKGIRLKSATAETHGGFRVWGFTLGGTPSNVKSLLQKYNLAGHEKGVVEDRVHAIIRPEPALRASPLIEGDPDSKTLKEMPSVLKDFEAAMLAFSNRVGMEVQLHFSKGPAFSPYPKNDTRLHLVIGASPPGSTDTLERLHLCGILMNDRGAWIQSCGPAMGYGVVVKDDKHEVAGQIVGNTFYLFIPSPENLNRALFFSGQGIELFSRVLALMWNAYADDAPEPVPALIAGAAEYEKFVKQNLSVYPLVQRIKIEEIDDEIKEILGRYRDKLNLKRVLLAAEKAYQATIDNGKDYAAEWSIIAGHLLVASVSSMGSAIMVETKWIVHEFDGSHYRLGRYMIRKPVGVPVSMWAIETAHPKRVPHPHISSHGVVCFGNATLAIEEANSEMRTADEMDLILRWLSEGYNPALAMAAIEQWPKAE